MDVVCLVGELETIPSLDLSIFHLTFRQLKTGKYQFELIRNTFLLGSSELGLIPFHLPKQNANAIIIMIVRTKKSGQ